MPALIEPAALRWPRPDDVTDVVVSGRRCPNCGSDWAKTLVLTATIRLPATPRQVLRLLRCPDCTARFYDDQIPPDYAEAELNSAGRIPFYVQQGAGLNLIIRPLARVRAEAGATFMEVGCGYGFGLDYAVRTRRWRSVGIDPAPLAAFGRAALGLPIEQRYLRDDDEARGAMDVVAGSEVIEHVPSPAAFLRTLRAMLRPGGVLVLTTPNGDDVRPSTPAGVLIPLLSPGLHLVLQSPRSLSRLLDEAGFGHVRVDVDTHSLVAFASDAPLVLHEDEAGLRTEIRRHLQARAGESDPAGDPFLGFAGRAFQESINDGDWAGADQSWSLLVPACRARFGLELDQLTALPPGLCGGDLATLAEKVPLNMAGLLYGSGVRKLASGTPRAAVAPRFALSAALAEMIRDALQALAMEDGQTEDLGWTATAELLICDAESGHPALPERVARLGPAPAGGKARRLQTILRVLTTTVNAGDYKMALELVRLTNVDQAPFASPVAADRTSTERDALYSLGILAVNSPSARATLGGLKLAQLRLARVRDHAEPDMGLWRSAVQAEQTAKSRLLEQATVPALAPSHWLGAARRRVRSQLGHVRHTVLPALADRLFANREPKQIVDKWPAERAALGAIVCVFAHFDAEGRVRADVLHHLASMAAYGVSVVFVSNSGALRPDAMTALQEICAGVIVRRNVGYDFGAWREGIEDLDLPRKATRLVILANDSVYGPVQPIDRLIGAVDTELADVWSCTDSEEIAYHLQSYWLAFSRRAMESEAWARFWAGVIPTASKHRVIRKYEIGLTEWFGRAGFRCKAVWDRDALLEAMPEAASVAAREQQERITAKLAFGRGLNPVAELWRPLICSGFPFLKRELLEGNPAGVVDIEEWRDVVRTLPGADASLIVPNPKPAGGG
ncbi:MAG: hypothetical protein NVSMB18_20720 [Acetobacteraceae bacterium]